MPGIHGLLFDTVSVVLIPIDIRRRCVEHLFAHVNGDHPHAVLVDMSKLAEKEVHYTWPVNVDLRVHEDVAWEAPRVLVIPELRGGDLVVRRVPLPPHCVVAAQLQGVAGDGEASPRFECSKGNAIVAGDIDELESTAVVDDRHATVQKAECAANRGNRELLQREPEEGDSRGGRQVTEEDAPVVVDPAQAAVAGDDGVGAPAVELPGIIVNALEVQDIIGLDIHDDLVGVVVTAQDIHTRGVPCAAKLIAVG